MAHKKGGGSSTNGRDSHSQRLGYKAYAGEAVKAGMIILRQRGTQKHAGPGVKCGRDHTLYAIRDGVVKTERRGGRNVLSVYAQ